MSTRRNSRGRLRLKLMIRALPQVFDFGSCVSYLFFSPVLVPCLSPYWGMTILRLYFVFLWNAVIKKYLRWTVMSLFYRHVGIWFDFSFQNGDPCSKLLCGVSESTRHCPRRRPIFTLQIFFTILRYSVRVHCTLLGNFYPVDEPNLMCQLCCTGIDCNTTAHQLQDAAKFGHLPTVTGSSDSACLVRIFLVHVLYVLRLFGRYAPSKINGCRSLKFRWKIGY